MKKLNPPPKNNRPYFLLGEAPNEATENHSRLWLRPDSSGIAHSANRLLEISGYTHRRYLELFDRDNLLHQCPPRVGRGRGFSPALGREQVPRIFDHVLERDYFGVLMLGVRVAGCFQWRRFDDEGEPTEHVGGAPPPFIWHYAVDSREADARRMRAVVVPHPSGINRQWNRPEIREGAQTFFRTIDDYARSRTR